MEHNIGMIVGKFYPLHQGHINMILQARQLVDQLILFVCSDSARDYKLFEESAMTRLPTSEDRTRWAQESFATIPGIQVESFLEDGIPAYPNGWEAWSKRLQKTLEILHIQPTIIFSSEPQDEALYRKYFNLPVQLMDPPRSQFNVSATQIRTKPDHYWHFIPTHIRPFFTKRILVEASLAQTTLLQSVSKLYQSVEPIDGAQLEFISIEPNQLLSSLNHYHQQAMCINGVIGSSAFIEQLFSTIEQITTSIEQDSKRILHKNIPCYNLNMEVPILAKSVQKRNDTLIQFNHLSRFIEQILQMPAINSRP